MALLATITPLAWSDQSSHIDTAALFHDQGPLFDSALEPSSTTPVTLTFRTAKDYAGQVAIKYYDTRDSRQHIVPMRRSGADPTGRYEYWRGTVPAGSSRKYYRFQIKSGAETVWYNMAGVSQAEPTSKDFYVVPNFKTPSWMKNGVIYQIFPDRFFDGNPHNDIRDGQYAYRNHKTEHHAWDSSVFARPGGDNSLVFFGGDLAGVRDKLSYIRNTVGADIVYLNPIFKAPSNHKYDTYDYKRVDPAFGTNQTLIDLVQAIHAGSGHIILDGVFNHTGDANPWFDHFHKNKGVPGADDSKASPYYTWYTFTHWPDKYASFFGYDSLPKLDYGNPAVKRAIYATPSSVVQSYLRAPYKIDGWRLDVAGMIDAGGKDGADPTNHAILRELRMVVKSVNPNAQIIGEMWDNPNAWTADGTQWDSALNFEGFTRPLSQWIDGVDEKDKSAPITATAFDNWLRSSRANYPMNVAEVMSNHLGNHDTPRFAERANGDLSKTRLALIFQMTYLGTPTLYYGDEYGMRGGADPDCRRTFDWSQGTLANSTVALTHKLTAIRRSYPALRTGSFMTLLADDASDTFAYGRFDAANRIAVVLNNSETAHSVTVPVFKMSVRDGSTLVDRLTGKRYVVKSGEVVVSLGARSGAVLAQ